MNILKNYIIFFVFMGFVNTSNAFDMALTKMDGSIDNVSQYKGKWVVINYWATWCPPCIEEMPELQAFHDDHHEKDGVVIGINSEDVSNEKLLAFLDDYFITYPNYVSEPAYNTKLGVLPGLPTTFIISPDGVPVAKQVGGITQRSIEDFIEKWKNDREKTK